jgi:hypothetical protein
VDADAALSGSQDFIVVDATLDNDLQQDGSLGWAIARTAGDYWVVGSLGGITNASQPTEYLFAPGTPANPALTPLWSFTGAGDVDNLDALLFSSNTTTDVLHVIAAGAANTGAGGNGGQAYWHEITVSK